MCGVDGLLANNRKWAAQRVSEDPQFFTRLARQQSPHFFFGLAARTVAFQRTRSLDSSPARSLSIATSQTSLCTRT
jgi:hypothetical protein